MHFQKPILLALLVFALPSCATQEEIVVSTDHSPPGKIDGFEDIVVTMAEAKAFQDTELRIPSTLHYGFTNELKGGWQAMGSLEIEYQDRASKPLTVTVPDSKKGYLAFVIESKRPGYPNSWSSDQFINLDAPQGSLVAIPVRNGAGYPFSAECYTVAVDNLGYAYEFDGRLSSIYYGYTNASRDEYQANHDVAWFNAAGDPVAAGEIRTVREHDGGYKGAYLMQKEWVWVPAGMNLVFKLGLDRYSGNCQWGDDTELIEHTETQTYFKEVL